MTPILDALLRADSAWDALVVSPVMTRDPKASAAIRQLRRALNDIREFVMGAGPATAHQLNQEKQP